jgi:hypothetical protein
LARAYEHLVAAGFALTDAEATVRGPRAVVNVDAVLALPQLERFAIIGGDKPRADHPHLRYVEWSGGRGR